MAKNKKALWLDVDGVLLDWIRPFLKACKLNVSYDDIDIYQFSYLFDSKEAFIKAVYAFNQTESYKNLLPLVSREDMKRLAEKYDLKIITQSEGRMAHDYRLINLNESFGLEMFSDIVFTTAGQSKAELLREKEPYDIISVVEDNPKFFIDAKRVGGFRSMAIQHPYNRKELKEIPDVPIYMGMQEVVRHLIVEGDDDVHVHANG